MTRYTRVWLNWRSALRIVKPETVIAWHRQGFRLYWKWKSGFVLVDRLCPRKSKT
jgi:hypothetical protein